MSAEGEESRGTKRREGRQSGEKEEREKEREESEHARERERTMEVKLTRSIHNSLTSTIMAMYVCNSSALISVSYASESHDSSAGP